MDVRIENHGNIVLLRPVSAVGRDWLENRIGIEGPKWGDAWIVEPRYVRPIVEDMAEDGLDLWRHL